MKIAIFSEGGPGKGFGHLTRCAALGFAFLEAGDSVVVYLDAPDDLEVFFAGMDVVFWQWQCDVVACGEVLKDVEIAVFDSYHTDESFFRELTKLFYGCMVFFDDNLRLDYPPGFIINGSADRTMYRVWENKGYRFLVGPSCQPMRKPFWECSRRICRADIRDVLVTLGGDDILGLMPLLYETLPLLLPEARLTFVSTRHSRTRHYLETSVRPPHRLLVDLSTEDLLLTMVEADLAVSAAGQTVYEMACTGLPVVLIQVVGNQSANVAAWLKTGYVLAALDGTDSELEARLRDAVAMMVGQNVRQICAEHGQRLVDGQGARRSVRLIKEGKQ